MTPAAVTISVRAQVLIAERVAQIAADSVRNAVAWEARLDATIQFLGTLPTACPVDDAATRRAGLTLRKLVFERTYLVHYTVDATAGVEVVSFRHGARRPGPHEP